MAKHLAGISRHVLGAPTTAAILGHILGAKFRRAASAEVRAEGAPPLAPTLVQAPPLRHLRSLVITPRSLVITPPPLLQALLGHIVEQKFEQRSPSSDVHDGLLLYLCGEQAALCYLVITPLPLRRAGM